MKLIKRPDLIWLSFIGALTTTYTVLALVTALHRADWGKVAASALSLVIIAGVVVTTVYGVIEKKRGNI